ncbi:MAG: TetR/AcrR family transcriptional regulator [Acidimicrobiia bacterium]|nr:TetR/AcrR family transcriptional regulator [Acidimicrobiia bacterium]
MTTLLQPRRTGQDTRNAILHVGAEAFRDAGYDVATLEQIATQLSITRAAVLHHFRSKQDLLNEIVRPVLAKLDDVLDRFEREAPLDARGRRRFFSELVDFACDNRAVTSLLVRDLTAHRHLDADLQVSERAGRFAGLVAQTHDQPDAIVAAVAALGTILRPVTAPETLVDLSTAESRRVLVECALAALREGLRRSASADR